MTTTTNAERLALADRLEAAVTHEGAPVYPYGDGRLRKLIVSAIAALRAQPAEAGAIVERAAAYPDNLAEIIEKELMTWRGANGGIYAIPAAALGVSITLRALNVAPGEGTAENPVNMNETPERLAKIPRKSLNDPVVDDRNSDEALSAYGEYTPITVSGSAATPAKPVSGEVREAINETICKHVRAYYDGIKGNREAADAILALSHFTAQSEALAEVRERLDSSQSLLAMLYQIGPDQPVWKAEEVDKLLADQMSENRAAIAKIDGVGR